MHAGLQQPLHQRRAWGNDAVMQTASSAYVMDLIHWKTLALRLPEGGVRATFPDNDSCRKRMSAVRWPSGVICLRCDSRDIAPESVRKTFRCRKCTYQFSPSVGTFVHGGNKPLLTYFLAAEHIIIRKAKMSDFKMVTAHSFKDRHRLAYQTARRLLSSLTRELLLEDGGLLGRCICSNNVILPPDVVPGSDDHFFWLSAALRR